MNNFKIGDRVRLNELIRADREDTDLVIGDIGIIVEIFDDICCVKFNRKVKFNQRCTNFNNMSNGYDLFDTQLELLER